MGRSSCCNCPVEYISSIDIGISIAMILVLIFIVLGIGIGIDIGNDIGHLHENKFAVIFITLIGTV